MEFMPPVHVEKIGTPQFPRFIMRDGSGHFWTGTSWSDNPREAALYYSKADAVAAENRYADGEHHVRDTYTLKLVIVTDRDAWTVEDLVTHLTYFGAVHLRKNDEPRGIVIEVHWDDLRKTE
jgi:hypothetical protein